jgi:hypothetical protein
MTNFRRIQQLVTYRRRQTQFVELGAASGFWQFACLQELLKQKSCRAFLGIVVTHPRNFREWAHRTSKMSDREMNNATQNSTYQAARLQLNKKRGFSQE